MPIRTHGLARLAVSMVRETFAQLGRVPGIAVMFDASGRPEVFSLPEDVAEAAADVRGLLREMSLEAYLVYHVVIRGDAGPAARRGVPIDLDLPSDPEKIVMIVACAGVDSQRVLALPVMEGGLGEPVDVTGRVETPFCDLLGPKGRVPVPVS